MLHMENHSILAYRVLLPGCHSGKESTRQCKILPFNPWVRKIPCRRKWQPTPVILPQKSHGQRSMGGAGWGGAGYSQWGRRVRHNRVSEQSTHEGSWKGLLGAEGSWSGGSQGPRSQPAHQVLALSALQSPFHTHILGSPYPLGLFT